MLRSVPFRLWLLCLLTFACFVTFEKNANITTRIGLTLSLLERHELSIDPFAAYTIDKAEVGGHVFSDKAPGLSLLALPVAAAILPMLDLPADPFLATSRLTYAPGYVALIAILTLCTVGAATATAAAFLFRWCRLRGSSTAAALFASLAYALGTPVMWWSTAFFGHATASALLLIGFVLLSESMVPDPSSPSGESRTRLVLLGRPILAGLVLGVSFMVEFPAGPAVAIIAGSCGVDAWLHARPWRRVIAVYLLSGVGLAWPLLAVGIYNAGAFGSPFRLGYANVQGFPGMQSGFFGVSLPNLQVARLLLIGQFRGLLPYSPVLWIVPFALLLAARERPWRVVAIGSALVFTWFWLMNSGYYYWWGGVVTGPRHLVPGLSLLLLPLAPLWDRGSALVRWAALALLGASIAMATALAALTISTPESTWQPFSDVWLPMLRAGDLPRLVTNLGGIHGYWGFLPLTAVWASLGYPFGRLLVRSAGAVSATPASRSGSNSLR